MTFLNSPLHVLLADDDGDDREVFALIVKQVAPTAILEFALDGTSLLDKLANSHPLPNIIFLDLNMPKKNGHTCLQEIKNNDRYKDIPVIIYSTSANIEDIDKTFKAGATHYFTKPSSVNDLKTALQYLLPKNFKVQPVALKDFVVLAKRIK